MLKECLDWLKTRIESASAPVPLGHDGHLHGRNVYVINGQIEEVKHDIPPRTHEVSRLEDLALWTVAGGDGSVPSQGPPETVTWCSIGGVVCVLDDDNLRRSFVKLPLSPHAKWSTCSKLELRTPLPHKSAVALLRDTFSDELNGANPDLLSKLRTLRTTGKSAAHSTAEHGRDALGKDIAAEVVGANDLPERITLPIPVWVEIEHVEHVTFGLTVDPFDLNVGFAPLPGELAAAGKRAVDYLTETTAAACDGRVYAGRPE